MPIPDRNQIYQDQDRYNRVNTYGPFGSQRYSTGADGRTEFTTELSPQMQGLVDRGMGLAGRDQQRYAAPQGMSQLIEALMGRMNRRTGGGQ